MQSQQSLHNSHDVFAVPGLVVVLGIFRFTGHWNGLIIICSFIILMKGEHVKRVIEICCYLNTRILSSYLNQ